MTNDGEIVYQSLMASMMDARGRDHLCRNRYPHLVLMSQKSVDESRVT